MATNRKVREPLKREVVKQAIKLVVCLRWKVSVAALLEFEYQTRPLKQASFASYLLRPRIYTKFHFMKAVASSFVFLYLHGAERLCPFFLLLSVKLFAFELPSGGVLFISFGKYVWSFWHRSRLSSLLVNPLLYTVHETQKIPDKILFWEPSTALLCCCRHCCGLVVVEALHYTSHTNSGSQNHISRMSGSVVVATRRQTRQ